MLRPLKAEVEAVAAMLMTGADSPEELATEVIKRVEELRAERTQWNIVFELSPGVYQGYGPFATRDAAVKAMPKIPMAQVAKQGGFVPVLGPSVADRQLAEADADEGVDRGVFKLVREDAAAHRAGWKNNNVDRSSYVS